MSGDGVAKGTMVILMVARAGLVLLWSPSCTQGQNGRDHSLLLALCHFSAGAGA